MSLLGSDVFLHSILTFSQISCKQALPPHQSCAAQTNMTKYGNPTHFEEQCVSLCALILVRTDKRVKANCIPTANMIFMFCCAVGVKCRLWTVVFTMQMST